MACNLLTHGHVHNMDSSFCCFFFSYFFTVVRRPLLVEKYSTVCVCVCVRACVSARACVQCVRVCCMARVQALCLPSLETTKPVYICKCFKPLTRITQSYLWPEYVCCVQKIQNVAKTCRGFLIAVTCLSFPSPNSDHMGIVLSSMSTRVRHVPRCFFRSMDVLLGKVNSHTLLYIHM